MYPLGQALLIQGTVFISSLIAALLVVSWRYRSSRHHESIRKRKQLYAELRAIQVTYPQVTVSRAEAQAHLELHDALWALSNQGDQIQLQMALEWMRASADYGKDALREREKLTRILASTSIAFPESSGIQETLKPAYKINFLEPPNLPVATDVTGVKLRHEKQIKAIHLHATQQFGADLGKLADEVEKELKRKMPRITITIRT